MGNNKKNNKDLTQLEVKYKLHKEELEKNPNKAKRNFILNLDENEELRHTLWEKLYWGKFDINNKIIFRNNKSLMLQKNDEQYFNMSYRDKLEWWDFLTNDGNALGIAGELNYIVFLLKEYKGNMKKVWAELKKYGEKKKNEQKREEKT